ncbi:MAG: signal peptidase II [Puniceicoccales bacterium]|jgi:signal peptidase II|nr:signal peptidase II [Puniceicoccales bacterium]
MNRKKSKIILKYIFFGTLLIDQGTKFLAETYLRRRGINFGKWLSFSLSHNTGCAWSFLQNNAFLLAILGVLILGIIFWKRHFLDIYRRPISFGLLLGGMVGNVIDRLCRGFVIDFIDVNLQIYRWPTFNVADAALCIAVVMLVLKE